MRKLFGRSISAAALILAVFLAGSFHGNTAPQLQKESLVYLYQGAAQGGQTETSVAAQITVNQPVVKSTDYHSLVELSIASTDGKQIVEVGWIVDRTGINGTDLTNPHLFVGAWVNNNFLGYNNAAGSGWVDNTAVATNAGASLASYVGAATPPIFGMVHYNSAWWVSFDGNYIGDFPDTLWTGATPSVTTFTVFNVFQGFGEVAANLTSPTTTTCTDMGSGVLPTAYGTPTTAAKIASVTYSATTAVLSPMSVAVPANYTNYVSGTSRSVTLGGPGTGTC
jgi:hypothetical protein